MDLNIDNYTESELFNILKIDNHNVDNEILQQVIMIKIQKIKNIDSDKLPENREDIIEFYIKIFFKLSNFIEQRNKIENNSKNILQPELKKSQVVQESNNFLIKQQDDNVITNFTQNFKRGIINPLQINTYKQVIIINTRFRDNYTNTESTNFIYNLPNIIKKVISMKVININISSNVYTYSDKLGSNSFKITPAGGVTTTIDISNGAYLNSELVDAINDSLINNGITNIKIGSNDINFKMDISSNDGSTFSLDFSYDNSNCKQLLSNSNTNQYTLGWIMGFRGNYFEKLNSRKNKHGCLVKDLSGVANIYTGKTSYTGETLYENQFSKYFLISINDYQNNNIRPFICPFNFESSVDNSILAKAHAYGNEHNPYIQNDIINPKRIYFGPVDIKKLHIILYDEVGRILDNNNSDYTITLELEVIYDY